ncbi:hypothetical protein [Shouchella clausii]|uniref:Uncharacterized protein n=1 Tax=Shouchella clausii TaxID=79880 RepID=A0A268NXI6_SHOCL|nr:hypothetical protein [Shouchella clausii]PAE87780.1 hypothetical protein CHH72_16760 [Shouchella clausii]
MNSKPTEFEELPIAKNLEELNDQKKQEFDDLAEEYSTVLQKINLFIEVNELDYNEAWDRANQQYDSDMTYAPDEG